MVEKPDGKVEPQSTQDESTSEKNYVTPEALNSAITNRLKSFEKKMEEQLNKMAEMVKPKEPEEKIDVSKDPTAPFKKDLEKIKKELEAARAEATQEKTSKRDLQMRSVLSEKLKDAGVAPNALKHAVGYLVDAEKHIGYDDDGNPIWDSDKSIDEGLKAWLKTSEAKIYLAPSGASGSGSKMPKGKPSMGGQSSKAEKRAEIAEALVNLVTGRIQQ